MIKIEFDGFSFQKQKQEIYGEGGIKFVKFITNSITDVWNGLNYKIQEILTPSCSLVMRMRFDEYQNFSLIQFAPDVTIFHGNNVYKSSSVYISLSTKLIANQFYEVTFNFGDILTQKVENVIFESEIFDYLRTPGTHEEFDNMPIHVPTVYVNDFSQNEASNFKNIINDYTKIQKSKTIRMYVRTDNSSIDRLHHDLSEITKSGGRLKLNSDTATFWQFKTKEAPIGKDIVKIDLQLFYDNPTITKTF